MKKWTVEMAVIAGVCIEGIEANSQKEAIEKAKNMFFWNPIDYIDNDAFGIEGINFVKEED